MKKWKKRANGKGSAIYLGKNREKPWGARITIGKDVNGTAIRYFIDFFESELDALVYLENYHKEPYSLYIKEEIYNRIITFPKNPYPLVPVKNPKTNDRLEKIKKDTYTFKQVFDEFKEMKLPTETEKRLEKERHIKPKGKLALKCANSLMTAYRNSAPLHDRVYKELKTSDFQIFLNGCGKSYNSINQMINLYRKLDDYALQEDIIEKGYASHISILDTKSIKKKKTVFTYAQIYDLWKMQTANKYEEFVRDIFLIALYVGARIEEILFIYTGNVFLDKGFFIGGLKTQAGLNREIPIHPTIKQLFEKYYNCKNEFLFMQNGKRITYNQFYWYYGKLKETNPIFQEHTVHDCRHSLRTELEKLNIKQVIINSILGHKNNDTGLDVYTHITIEEKQEAIKLVTYKEQKKLYIFNPETTQETQLNSRGG